MNSKFKFVNSVLMRGGGGALNPYKINIFDNKNYEIN